MDFQFNLTVVLFLLSVGGIPCLVLGYLWGKLERRNRARLRQEQAQVERRVAYTQGAAYDACLDEPTSNDNEVARRLLNW